MIDCKIKATKIINWDLLGLVTRQNQTDGTKLFVKNQSKSVRLHSTHSRDKCQKSDIFIAALSWLSHRPSMIFMNSEHLNSLVSGIKWHDVACTHEKPIICEDVDGHLAYARQHFPQIRIPWKVCHEMKILNKVANIENYWLKNAIPCNTFSSHVSLVVTKNYPIIYLFI